MADIKLSLAITPYDRVLPLITGEVKPDGITLEYAGWPGSSMGFYQQIKFKRFDVSEMSFSSFLRMRSIGWPYRILPVFHNRNFAYTTTAIRKSSGIRQGHPEDLKGKRVGVGDYQQSLGLWVRGILQMEFGVKTKDIIWYQERSQHFSHTGASADAGLGPPEGIDLRYAEKDLGEMFLNGELDASTSYAYGVRVLGADSEGLDRQRGALEENPDIVALFQDPREEAVRYFTKTGVFPPHHTTAVRESILDEHPWVAISLMEAFEEAKKIAIERLRRSLPRSLLVFGQYTIRELDDIFGTDPYPYGIKANARAIEMAQTFSVEQGLTDKKQPLEEIFPLEVIYREERL
ncbi:MAG: hypothetical protein Q8O55_10955 [Dehalococcoidales bacterium]|nr:hypothetical protein [Dehalococcoidales bacterium]